MGTNKAMISLGFWLLAAMLIGLAAPPDWAGGLWLYERRTPEVGTANAGAAARSEDVGSKVTFR
jgi:hypothetical protein